MAPAQAQRRSPNAAHTSGTAAATARTLGAGGGRQVRRPNLGGGARTRRHSRASGAPATRQQPQRSGSGARARHKPRARRGHQQHGSRSSGRTRGGHQGSAARQPSLGPVARTSGAVEASRARQPKLGPVEHASGIRAQQQTGREPRALGASAPADTTRREPRVQCHQGAVDGHQGSSRASGAIEPLATAATEPRAGGTHQGAAAEPRARWRASSARQQTRRGASLGPMEGTSGAGQAFEGRRHGLDRRLTSSLPPPAAAKTKILLAVKKP